MIKKVTKRKSKPVISEADAIAALERAGYLMAGIKSARERRRGRAEVHRDECVLCNGQPESCDVASCLIGAELAGKSPEQLWAIAETQWRWVRAPEPDRGDEP